MARHLHTSNPLPQRHALQIPGRYRVLRAGIVALFLLVSASLTATNPVVASPQPWTSIGPFGDTVRGLAVDPLVPSTLAAGANQSLFASADSGANWSLTIAHLSNAEIHTVVIDAATPATRYVGTAGDGIYKSLDGGATWNTANAGLSNLWVLTLAQDPTSPTTLYAGTFAGYSGTGTGLFKSTDGGMRWTAVVSGIVGLSVQALIVDPTSPATLYAAANGVFKSTDGGLNWYPSGTGLGTPVSVYALAIDPQHPTTLYAGTGDSVYRSQDGGASWSLLTLGPPLLYQSYIVYSLAIDPQTPSIIYAGTSQGIYSSANGGDSWRRSGDGAAYVLAIDPVTPSTIYAGTSVVGVRKSVDGGLSWATVNQGLSTASFTTLTGDPTQPATIYAAGSLSYAARMVYASGDGGETWSPMTIGAALYGHIQTFVVDPTVPTTLYVGTDGRNGFEDTLFKSTDGRTSTATSWSGISGELRGRTIFAVAVDSTNNQTVYVGTDRNGGVYKSTDGGQSWALPSADLYDQYVVELVIDPTRPATLYAATFTGIYQSLDGGSHWHVLRPFATSIFHPALVLDPSNPTTLYVSESPTIAKTSDGGATWQTLDLSSSGAATGLLVLAPNHPRMLYASTTTGIAKSIDGGAHWTSVPLDGLSNATLSTLLVTPTSPPTLYAGTSGTGVFALHEPLDIQLDAPAPIAEGDVLTLHAVIHDIAGHGPWTVAVNNGDGSAQQLSVTSTPQFDVVHRYDTSGQYTTLVTVTNTLGDSAADVASVQVQNVPPTATFGNTGPIDQGSVATVFFADPFDPSNGDRAAGFSYSYDFDNDGTFDITATTALSATVPVNRIGHDPGTYPVRGRIADRAGGSTDYITTITVNPVADLALAAGTLPPAANIGVPFTYTFALTNDGPAIATDVVLSDTLSANSRLLQTAPGCAQQTRVLVCTLGTLSPGASTVITVTVIPMAEGSVTNTAEVTAHEIDSDRTNNQVQQSLQVHFVSYVPFF